MMCINVSDRLCWHPLPSLQGENDFAQEVLPLYLVKYNTILRRADCHEALFIAKRVEGTSNRGPVYQLQGPDKLRGQLRKQFSFYFDIDIDPERSEAFRSMQKIGRVTAGNLRKVYHVCEDVQPPMVPMKCEGEFPNCCDWVKNVLYQLDKQNIVEFNDTFTPPSKELDLVACKPCKPTASSQSAGSSKAGSSAKVPSSSSSQRRSFSKGARHDWPRCGLG